LKSRQAGAAGGWQAATPFASFDESALTGESAGGAQQRRSVACRRHQRRSSGAADRGFRTGDSAIDRILKLIEEAEAPRAD
jgi:Cd2+/Zn2+-exporting ATPase